MREVGITERGWIAGIFGALGLLALVAGQAQAVATTAHNDRSVSGNTAARLRTPEALFFVPNRGQIAGDARFVLAGHDRTASFRPDGVTITLASTQSELQASPRLAFAGSKLPDLLPGNQNPERKVSTFSLDFVDETRTEPFGSRKAVTRVSYWGNGHELGGLPTYGEIRYPNVWPGIDLSYTAGNSRVKYEARVAPGADAARVAFRVRGAQRVSIGSAGDLCIETPTGELTDAAPIAYQQIEGKRQQVACRYALTSESDGDYRVGFKLGAYDPQRMLIIDPATIVYSGFVGGDGPDACRDAVVDATGSLYVAGSTSSSPASFPSTVGTTLTRSGPTSAFIGKLLPDGSAWEYLGFLSSDIFVNGNGVAVDSEGAAYLTGSMKGAPSSFPVKVGPHLTPSGDVEGFIARVAPDGKSLDYCGYIAGNGMDFAQDVAVDSSRRAYVVGTTYSSSTTFPVVVGPDLTRAANADGFVARVSATGAEFEYCGFVGGNDYDEVAAVDVDSGGRAVIVGTSQSTAGFPLVGPLDTSYNGGIQDGFVGRVSGSGAQMEYCGYLGGTAFDAPVDVVVGPDHTAYVCGVTTSSAATFPVHGGLAQTPAGAEDGFLARVNATGSALLYCGYFGGTKPDYVWKCALAADGVLWIAGRTASTEADGFPLREGPDATYNGGPADGFVARFRASDGTLLSSGYIGGLGLETARIVCPLSATEACIVGILELVNGVEPGAGFPLVGTRDRTFGGRTEGFAMRLQFVPAPANQPDLVASVRLATWKKSGKSFQFRWTVPVTNRGNAVALPSQARIYFSRDAALSLDDTLLKAQKAPRLAARKTRTLQGSASKRLPTSPAGGWLLVRADALEQIAERDETNNLAGRVLKRVR